METKRKNSSMVVKNNIGIALITSLLILSAITTLSMIALNTILTDLKISQNMKDIKKAFYHAEAGIRHAIQILNTSHDGFDEELKAGFLNFGPSVNFAGGHYEVSVIDNNDGDPNYDSDNIIILTSTGKSNSAIQTIELMVHKLLIPMETDGALIIHHNDPTLDIHGNPSIDGRDWNVPPDFNCSGAGCNGEPSAGVSTAGLYTTDELIRNYYGEGSSLMVTGDPNIREDGDGLYTNRDWQDLINKFIPKADITYPGAGNITGSHILGTRESPHITVVENKAKFTGNVRGAGILIVINEAAFQGSFHFEGLLIIVNNNDDGGDELDLGSGRATIFGSLIITGSESSKVCLRNKACIKYSSQALSNISDHFGRAKIISWRNRY